MHLFARKQFVPEQDSAELRIGQEESIATLGYIFNPKTAARGGGHGLAARHKFRRTCEEFALYVERISNRPLADTRPPCYGRWGG